ncbi:MAG TPA: hypothetical protein VLA62_08920, partial [Solirubrobacterales bacterium]|nr:hypothetical protein [Solirubrobacterales bacterium]
MADVPAVTWRSLSPPARRAFEIGLAWAESGSKESPLVRSEDLLLGLDRAERAASESQQLLSHLGLRREDLVSALARGRDAPKRVKPLDELPALSPHAQEVLRAAGDLHGPPAPAKMRMVPRHLFGGILAVEESFAYRALERVVGEGISLEALRTAYPAFLALGPKARFRDFLRERFPARPATKLPPEPPSAAPAERPSPLALVEHEGTAAGVAVAPDLVVTTLEGLTAISFRPEPSTGVTVILADGSRADALVQAFA